ncbi:MAG TPA: hypothetical protein VL947_04520 [Cytophagales bacterium]|nr:hypothetical protein [Cytophagales bacterium]
MKKITILTSTLLMLISCEKAVKQQDLNLSKSEMMAIVTKAGQQFGQGVQKGDSAYIVDIYSDSAHYVVPKRPIMIGKKEIAKEWGSFLKLKEKPVDLVLHVKDVRGNREVIYETGQGYTLLADSSRWEFNYVNVWRLQNDGSYKLEVDTYN